MNNSVKWLTVAGGVAGAAFTGGASLIPALSQLGSAGIQSSAAGKAAKTQSEAATRAAEIQAQSEREALAFKREQAAQDLRQAEAAQHANYDQWRAREGRMSGLGSLLGLPAREIPAYVPIPTAPPTGATYGGGSTAGLVTMRAPTGQTKQVPASEQAYWTQKGATVIS